MSEKNPLGVARVIKWIRILLALAVIALSAYRRFWPITILGVAYLLMALTGVCSFNLRLGSHQKGSDDKQP